MWQFSLERLSRILKGTQSLSTGALLDPRTFEEQGLDFGHEERLGFGLSTDPFSNEAPIAAPISLDLQNGTSSCGTHSAVGSLEVERKLDTGHYTHLSKIFTYRMRANYPQEGTWLQDVFAKLREHGAPLYASCPTPQTEYQANRVVITPAMRSEALINRGGEYWSVKDPNNITTLAKIADVGHSPVIFVYATYKEWAQMYPSLYEKSLSIQNAEVVHFVSIIPKSGFVKDGIQYVGVMDTAQFGGYKIRYLSKFFIQARVTQAFYWDTVQEIGSGPRPQFTFTRTMTSGCAGDDVKALQYLLVSEGLLANDNVSGQYWGKTTAAVRAFQMRYEQEILRPIGLTEPTNTFGPRCIAVANNLCK